MKINKYDSALNFDMLIEYIDAEISIEIDDKIQLHDDGVNIANIYMDDFFTLKKLLYNDIEYYKQVVDVRHIRFLLDYIDDKIVEAITYIKYKYIVGKEGRNENRHNKAF